MVCGGKPWCDDDTVHYNNVYWARGDNNMPHRAVHVWVYTASASLAGVAQEVSFGTAQTVDKAYSGGIS